MSVNDYKKPAKGQWANAPLVFVLAQVRFGQQQEGFTERCQQVIADLEPQRFLPAAISPLMQVNIEIADGGKQTQSMVPMGTLANLAAKDGRMLVRVAPDSLTLAVTSYTNSADFRALWLPMVDALATTDLKGPINRLGLRYVDFVVPSANESVETYVNAPWNLAGATALPGAVEAQPGLHYNLLDVGYPRGRMRLQFLRGFGTPSLPADLQGILAPEPVQMERPDGQSAVIDTDRSMDGEWKVGDNSLQSDFVTMHTDLSKAFKHMVSDYAKQRWNPAA